MDIDNFLELERRKVLADEHRLKKKQNEDTAHTVCKGLTDNSCNEYLDEHQRRKSPNMDFYEVSDPAYAGAAQSQHIENEMCIVSSMATSSSKQSTQQNARTVENEIIEIRNDLHGQACNIKNTNSTSKTAKDIANLSERKVKDASAKQPRLNKTKDEMEQWVSDTFYSYFPGFNNENKKRQDILRDRQLEYQQNFLRHQMTQAAADAKVKKNKVSNENTKHTTPDQTQKTVSSRSDKTELEIIVNNPDYEGKSPRPGSARHKLLQDLKHTEISNIVNSDGVTERNQRNAEMEMAKKKNYQKELMAQIEEKRRIIEELKEKERRQEEALTRKLQEQLRTMRLEEELEKERLRAEKVRFDSEQSRLMREHLLTKLENDTKLLSARKTQSENEKTVPLENKVYKYFSNSARREYKRGSGVDPPAFNLNLPQSSSPREDVFLSHEAVCPFCDSPLKMYENLCLKCENRIRNASRSHLQLLICNKCKKQYSVCENCEETVDLDCVHCQNKRNVCAKCRKLFYRDCCEKSLPKTDSESSFQILDVNYPDNEDNFDFNSNNLKNIDPDHCHLPFSVNIDRNSIFHQAYDRNKLLEDENNIEVIRRRTDNKLSRYLKHYGDLAKNAKRDNSTQTTPESASRRDIVMVEENLSMPLLREMPRLTRKESDSQELEKKKKSTRIENLSRRWEVPAIQKHIITTNSPKVLTQLGAIRKQLQSEQF